MALCPDVLAFEPRHPSTLERFRRSALRRKYRTGFGLLEVIVALVLLSTTGLALFSWINQNMSSASRLRETIEQAQLSVNAQALVADVNPALTPNGERESASVRIEWTSSVVQPMRVGTSFVAGSPGAWQIALYQLKVKAEDRLKHVKTEFEVLQTGQIPSGIGEVSGAKP